MPRGGEITIELASGAPDNMMIGARPDLSPGACVVLTVRDNGIGMATLERIFVPSLRQNHVGKGQASDSPWFSISENSIAVICVSRAAPAKRR